MVSELFSLSGKVILVSGGYGYLGKSITLGLAEHGAKVVVLGRSKQKFDDVFNFPDIYFFEMDISSSESVKECFASIFQQFGRIDVLINNAFYSRGNDPEKMTDEDWSFGVDGNLNSTFRCIREIIPYFKQNKNGRIINVASMYGMVSPDFKVYENNDFLNPPHYGAAKAGVIQMTKYYACYLGKYNILVNCVSPGPFPSEMVQENEEFIANLKAKNPLGRIGTPDDLKGVFVLLRSDASKFITGQNFAVDGGWTAW